MRLFVFFFFTLGLPCLLLGQEFHKASLSVIKNQRSESAIDIYRRALRYKNGNGVPVDYEKSFKLFKQAADMGDAQSQYATAYCYYKGLGVRQDYETAVKLFAMGARQGRDNSMYFTGLCFENGYGVTRNADSAKYWLGKAAALGYQQAIEELKSPKGENSNDSAVALLAKISKSSLPQDKPINEFTLVQPHIPSGNLIYGSYNGYIVRYDWSGKFLISSSPVRINLKEAENPSTSSREIKGTWQEKGADAVPLSAALSGDSVIFSRTKYTIKDHYSWDRAITYDFNSASLNLVQSGDSVYLSGNITMFSPERNEPSKPIFIALVRSDAISGALRDSVSRVFNKDNEGDLGLVVIKHARVYPNPFISSFTTEFILTESSKVSIQLLNMSGALVYKKPDELLQKGKYAILVSPGRISGGMYIIRIISRDGNFVDLKVIRK